MENAYLKIAENSKKYKTVQNLMAKINKENLLNQHKLQISKKAWGIDRVNKTEYGENLEQNIEKLLRKMKNFAYRPLPVKSAVYVFFNITDCNEPKSVVRFIKTAIDLDYSKLPEDYFKNLD